jgi:hypothetical protein
VARTWLELAADPLSSASHPRFCCAVQSKTRNAARLSGSEVPHQPSKRGMPNGMSQRFRFMTLVQYSEPRLNSAPKTRCWSA